MRFEAVSHDPRRPPEDAATSIAPPLPPSGGRPQQPAAETPTEVRHNGLVEVTQLGSGPAEPEQPTSGPPHSEPPAAPYPPVGRPVHPVAAHPVAGLPSAPQHPGSASPPGHPWQQPPVPPGGRPGSAGALPTGLDDWSMLPVMPDVPVPIAKPAGPNGPNAPAGPATPARPATPAAPVGGVGRYPPLVAPAPGGNGSVPSGATPASAAPVSSAPISATPVSPVPANATQAFPAVVGAVAAPGALRPRTDFALVRELRRQLSERITRWQRGRDYTGAEEAAERERLAVEVVGEYADGLRRSGTPLTGAEERALLDQVTAELVGLGRLQNLLVDDTIEEVHILGCDSVRITRRGGGVDWGEPIADSDEEMVEILQAAARRTGATERSLSTSKPTLDLQLPDGSRLAAVFLVSHRPYAVIRRHNTLEVTLDEIAGARADLDEMIDPLLRDFLRASMRAGLNIMVAGLAGAGKTTLIRALMDEIPADEPFVLLEESRELLPPRGRSKHRAVMSFESREGHGERGLDGRPAGEVNISDLIPVALRMGVLRIIVGEVRSREIVPMLQAMTTSRGSMCTIHARTPSAVSERIIELALSHGREMTVEHARRMAGNALDLIVYVTVEDETAIGGRKYRFVSHVEEVVGVGEGNRIVTTTVFGPGPDGRAIPQHLPERIREQLLRVGYDARLLSRYIEARAGSWRRPKHSRLGRAA